MSRVVKATALKPWRGLRARDLSCSNEVVETRAIETMSKQLCENVGRLGDQWNVAQESYQQSDQLRRNDVERTGLIRFLNRP